VEIVFDPKKDAANKRKHGVSLSQADDFDFESALYSVDGREDYGEIRYQAVGFLDARLYTLVFAESDDGDIRAISLRKATRHEAKDYEENR
jgi:uncharacterized DUF497 family protein